MHTHVHTHICTPMYTCTHTHTHTHAQCLTVEQLQSISQLALSASGDPDVRADVMTILGTAGRMALKNKAPGLQMLSVRFMYTYHIWNNSHSCGSLT